MRRAGSSVSTLPAAPSRTTEPPVKSVIRNDTEAAPRCSLSIRATTSRDSTGAAASAAASVPAKVIALAPATLAVGKTSGRPAFFVRPAYGHGDSSLLTARQRSGLLPSGRGAASGPGAGQLPVHHKAPERTPMSAPDSAAVRLVRAARAGPPTEILTGQQVSGWLWR